MLDAAAGAEAEAALEKPARQATGAGVAIRLEATGNRCELAIVAAQRQIAVLVRLQPAIGQVGLLQVVDVIAAFWIRHYIAVEHLPVALTALIPQLPGLNPYRSPVVQMGPDRVELLSAVAAEHERVKQRLATGVGLILLRLEGEIAPASRIQRGVHVAAG